LSIHIIMFLILSASFCKYCVDAKQILNNNNLKYIDIDINLKSDNWRSILISLSSLTNDRKSIPIIFQSKDPNADDLQYAQSLTDILFKSDPDYSDFSAFWTYVGGYTDLQNLIDNIDISIDNNY
jgi:glutaredoxin